jgi:hypothetical protein
MGKKIQEFKADSVLMKNLRKSKLKKDYHEKQKSSKSQKNKKINISSDLKNQHNILDFFIPC